MRMNFKLGGGLLTSALIFGACSSRPHRLAKVPSLDWGRAPASDFKDSPKSSSMETMLNQLARSFYITQKNLNDFDASLDAAVSKDKEFNLRKVPSYSRLQAGRELSERIRENIQTDYEKLSVAAIGSDSASREEAVQMLTKFHSQLARANGSDVLAFIEVARGVQDYNHAHAKDSLRVRELLALTPEEWNLEHVSPSEDKDYGVLVADAEKTLHANSVQAGKVEDGIFKQIQTLSAQMEKASSAEGREPQELKIFPTASNAGNITGSNFPASTWALTFDDGPSPVYTPQALKFLAEHQTKATFFWLAKNVVNNVGIVNQAKAAGMPLENHSYSHVDLSRASTASLQREIDLAQAKETAAYGKAPEFFRTPYGAGFALSRVRSRIVALKMIHTFWNVDSLDWQDKNSNSVLARVQKQMRANKRGIILFHDIHPQSIAASRMLLNWVGEEAKRGNKMRFLSLPQIVAEVNGVAQH